MPATKHISKVLYEKGKIIVDRLEALVNDDDARSMYFIRKIFLFYIPPLARVVFINKS